jgi:hypothetical protein
VSNARLLSASLLGDLASYTALPAVTNQYLLIPHPAGMDQQADVGLMDRQTWTGRRTDFRTDGRMDRQTRADLVCCVWRCWLVHTRGAAFLGLPFLGLISLWSLLPRGLRFQKGVSLPQRHPIGSFHPILCATAPEAPGANNAEMDRKQLCPVQHAP